MQTIKDFNVHLLTKAGYRNILFLENIKYHWIRWFSPNRLYYVWKLLCFLDEFFFLFFNFLCWTFLFCQKTSVLFGAGWEREILLDICSAAVYNKAKKMIIQTIELLLPYHQHISDIIAKHNKKKTRGVLVV